MIGEHKMNTEVFVDLLRKTLTDRGHILPTSAHRDSECIILNQGEYLVSLLSHDQSLAYFLDQTGDPGFQGLMFDWRKVKPERRQEVPFFWLTDFDLWVDAVKFTWLVHGTSTVLDFIKNTGFSKWSGYTSKRRARYVDDLVLIAQKKLRQTGTSFREMAEFFADAKSSQELFDEPLGVLRPKGSKGIH